MGTRGAFGFVVNEDLKVSYNHFDSYPDGLGKDVVHFIKLVGTVNNLLTIAKQIELIDSDSKPTKKQIKECENWTDLNVASQSTDDWYCLLRDSQGDLMAYTKGLKYMIDSRDFLHDSLFCEYAYLINLHTEKLEVYSGFNKDPNAAGMFARMQDSYTNNDGELIVSDYYGVALVMEIPISEIFETTTVELLNNMNHVMKENGDE